MRLIPVLDVLNGVVVRGIAGRRSEYRPIVSRLTRSVVPAEVARALVEAVDPRELYLADLDAIQNQMPAYEAYRSIRELGRELWVDAGVADCTGAVKIVDAGCSVIAGLETVPNPESLRSIVEAVGPSRVIFSLDLRDGLPLREWNGMSPFQIARVAIGCGITRIIVLDLARVGLGSGTGTDVLCEQIASMFPHVEVVAGGGVSSREELHQLANRGIQGLLVASALHDERLNDLLGRA